jgi:hypothetical protein
MQAASRFRKVNEFRDINDIPWTVAIDEATLAELKANVGVDLLESTAIDPPVLVDVLVRVCGDQLRARGMDRLKLKRVIKREAIGNAQEALRDAVAVEPADVESDKEIFAPFVPVIIEEASGEESSVNEEDIE